MIMIHPLIKVYRNDGASPVCIIPFLKKTIAISAELCKQ